MNKVVMRHDEKHTYFFDKSCELSNWYMRDFAVKGITFNCNEQFLMYCKAKIFGDEVVASKILAAKWPGAQKSLGREVAGFNEDVWVKRRESIMDHGTFHKFDQNPDLRRVMFQSLETKFVEAAWWDSIWGVGLGINDPSIIDESKWKGKNLLGKSLDRSMAKLVEKYPEEYANIAAELKLAVVEQPREDIPGLGI